MSQVGFGTSGSIVVLEIQCAQLSSFAGVTWGYKNPRFFEKDSRKSVVLHDELFEATDACLWSRGLLVSLPFF